MWLRGPPVGGVLSGFRDPVIHELTAQERARFKEFEPTPLAQAPRYPDLQVFRDDLKDRSRGPEMVVIPAGSFMMGSPDDEVGRDADEGPQHQVTLSKAFALGVYEVTFDDYERFATATKRELPDDEGWGRGRRPVINVSWNDAQAYVAWLSEQTGLPYRLPTEAEWEYAARAGTTTVFWSGECINTDQANYDGNADYNECGANTGVYREQTVEVGSLSAANPWLLHDVAGNVWEWTQDCWHDTYQGAPAIGRVWETEGDCALRVLRGGGWSSNPRILRSALRFGFGADITLLSMGFRLARTL